MIKNSLPKTDLTLSAFHYDLPEERIAQTPVYPRDSSRLMVVDRTTPEYTVEHRTFRDILDYLRPEDVLVINDTRVIPARIIGRRIRKMTPDGEVPSEGTGAVELLLLKQLENDVWEALAGPGKRAKPGDTLAFGEGDMLLGHVESVGEGGCRRVRLEARGDFETVYEALHTLGTMPLPPTSPNSCRIRSGIRPYTQGKKAPLPLPQPVFTLPRS